GHRRGRAERAERGDRRAGDGGAGVGRRLARAPARPPAGSAAVTARPDGGTPVTARRDGRRARGERTRAAVLRRAADLSSVEGLDNLTIGRLAADLQVSKAGVFAHFGSKEALQLATVRHAAERFTDAVVTPVLAVPDGLPRLVALCDRWLAYSAERVFP